MLYYFYVGCSVFQWENFSLPTHGSLSFFLKVLKSRFLFCELSFQFVFSTIAVFLCSVSPHPFNRTFLLGFYAQGVTDYWGSNISSFISVRETFCIRFCFVIALFVASKSDFLCLSCLIFDILAVCKISFIYFAIGPIFFMIFISTASNLTQLLYWVE